LVTSKSFHALFLPSIYIDKPSLLSISALTVST
jgi:hypothetical protein